MRCAKYIAGLALGMLLGSCKQEPKTTLVTHPNPTDRIAEESKNELVSAKITIKNPSDYAPEFIDGLKPFSNYGPFELKDSLMIVAAKDTVVFPDVPKIGQRTMLTGKKDNLAIALKITRINYTSIEYRVEMVEFGKANHTQTGKAHLNPGMFLGDESETDQDGDSYEVFEFSAQDKDCHFTIKLGKDGKRSYLLGTLIKNCNGKIRAIDRVNFVTLREK